MTQAQSHHQSEETIYLKLVESPLFQTYRKAFVDATGLPLILLPAASDIAPAAGEVRSIKSPFCHQLNQNGKTCEQCDMAHQCLSTSSVHSAETITCFAGMRESSIPVRAAKKTVALLSTGQIFTSEPGQKEFHAALDKLPKEQFDSSKTETLRQAYFETRTVPLEQYEGMITILAAFALQLSDLLNRILIEESHSEPSVIVNAKKFINANLEDKISLEMIANHVNVSQFYFCKLFKQSTGMTLTEFVNRRRIEWAKKKLLNPQTRITEVAFDVGYQSLSQFNRSFQRYVGESPTRFREKQRKTPSTDALHANEAA